MEEQFERDFKGIWIPKEIWLDTRLTALEKVILMEIDSLDTNEEGCYASNKYISEFCQCKERKVSLAINKLIELGYLELKNFDGRRRYLQSRLAKSARQTSKKCEADTHKMLHINIDNNIDNNIKEKYKKEIDEIINYFNQPDTDEPIRSFTKTSKNTRSKISARLNEGFTVDDLKDVIFYKYNEWVKKPVMFKNGVMSDTYYRPDTLFSTNFENYLQEYKTKTK